MADKRQLEIIREGVAPWNKWREENPQQPIRLDHAELGDVQLIGANLIQARLQDANLSGADLREAYLDSADLSGAILVQARVSWANLIKAHLSGADLERANFFFSRFCEADLREAYLDSADLSGADLSDADLSGANLRQANLTKAQLVRSNLQRAKPMLKWTLLRDPLNNAYRVTEVLRFAVCLLSSKPHPSRLGEMCNQESVPHRFPIAHRFHFVSVGDEPCLLHSPAMAHALQIVIQGTR